MSFEKGRRLEDNAEQDTNMEAMRNEEMRLGQNLEQLSDNLDELEAMPPSRREKIEDFVRENYASLGPILIGLGAGAGSGNLGDFLFKTGLGFTFGAAAKFAQKRSERWLKNRAEKRGESKE